MLAGCMLMSMPPLVWHACASMQPHACAFPPHADTYGQQSCGHSWTRNIQDRRLFSRRGLCEHLPGGDRGWMVGAKVRTCVRAACAGLVSKSGAAGTCTVAQLGLLSFGGSHSGLLSSGGSQLGLLSFGGPRHAVLRSEVCALRRLRQTWESAQSCAIMRSIATRRRRRWYLRRCLLRSCAVAMH